MVQKRKVNKYSAKRTRELLTVGCSIVGTDEVQCLVFMFWVKAVRSLDSNSSVIKGHLVDYRARLLIP